MLYNNILKSESKELYVSPEVNVYETECEGVLCSSVPKKVDASIEGFDDGGTYDMSIF